MSNLRVAFHTFDVPYTWEPGYDNAYYESQSIAWGNSLFPYVKSWDVFKDPIGNPTPSWFGTPSSTLAKPQYLSYTYNGLLSQWPTSGVTAPAQLPAFTILTGGTPNFGEGFTSPTMECNDATKPCVYQPAVSGCNSSGSSPNGSVSYTIDMTSFGGSQTTTTVWLYGHGMPFAMADGHVKWRPLGANIDGTTDYHVDPFSNYNAIGYPREPRALWFEQYGCHVLTFRPDFDFATWGNPFPR